MPEKCLDRQTNRHVAFIYKMARYQQGSNRRLDITQLKGLKLMKTKEIPYLPI
jgi:hypothetical protein